MESKSNPHRLSPSSRLSAPMKETFTRTSGRRRSQPLLLVPLGWRRGTLDSFTYQCHPVDTYVYIGAAYALRTGWAHGALSTFHQVFNPKAKPKARLGHDPTFRPSVACQRLGDLLGPASTGTPLAHEHRTIPMAWGMGTPITR